MLLHIHSKGDEPVFRDKIFGKHTVRFWRHARSILYKPFFERQYNFRVTKILKILFQQCQSLLWRFVDLYGIIIIYFNDYQNQDQLVTLTTSWERYNPHVGSGTNLTHPEAKREMVVSLETSPRAIERLTQCAQPRRTFRRASGSLNCPANGLAMYQD